MFASLALTSGCDGIGILVANKSTTPIIVTSTAGDSSLGRQVVYPSKDSGVSLMTFGTIPITITLPTSERVVYQGKSCGMNGVLVINENLEGHCERPRR